MILLRQQAPFSFPSIISILAMLSAKQPYKHQPITISPSEISIGSLDDSQTILIGVQLPTSFFSAFICQKSKQLLFPLSRLSKILSLCNEEDSSITIQYQEGQKQSEQTYKIDKQEIKIRIHSLKNDQKLVVHLPIKSSFGEMISQKYEEPFNVVQYVKNLQILPQLSISNNQNEIKKVKLCCRFKFSCIQFLRVCSQFVELTPRIIISYQSELESNKKYLTFSSQTQQGLKSIVLSQEKTQIEQQRLRSALIEFSQTQFMNMPQKVQFSDFFNSSLLFEISLISKNNEKVLDEDVTIFMEKDKGFFAQFSIKNGGVFVALVGPAQ